MFEKQKKKWGVVVLWLQYPTHALEQTCFELLGEELSLSKITFVYYNTNIFYFSKIHLNPINIIFMGLVICHPGLIFIFFGTPHRKKATFISTMSLFVLVENKWLMQCRIYYIYIYIFTINFILWWSDKIIL